MKERRRWGQRGEYEICREAATFSPFPIRPAGRTLFTPVIKEVEQVTPADLKQEDGTQMVIPDFEIDAIARALLPTLRAFYANPEGQAAFEEWKREKEVNQ